MEAVREEKAAAVRALSADGVAILNADDEGARWMATQTAARVRWFGLQSACAVSARDVVLDWPHGTRLTLLVEGRAVPLRTRLIGRHFVYPLLAAVSGGLAAGLHLEQMVPALERLSPTPARLEPWRLANGAYLLCDDYKGTPETFAPALAVLAGLPARRRLVVLGDLNNLPSLPAAPHYAEVGAAVAAVADAVLVVGARLDAYRAGLLAAGFPSSRLSHAADIGAATAALRGELRDGDVALLKGCEDQGLTRIALALAGRAVRCPVTWCAVRLQTCTDCPLLDVPLPFGAGVAP
jgi:UDP-N-acetylmuramoyl-tripeptide--D-alanyl-D-alanine ligase